jgi:hypothetical protein
MKHVRLDLIQFLRLNGFTLRTLFQLNPPVLTCLAIKITCLSGNFESLIVNNCPQNVSDRNSHLAGEWILL